MSTQNDIDPDILEALQNMISKRSEDVSASMIDFIYNFIDKLADFGEREDLDGVATHILDTFSMISKNAFNAGFNVGLIQGRREINRKLN